MEIVRGRNACAPPHIFRSYEFGDFTSIIGLSGISFSGDQVWQQRWQTTALTRLSQVAYAGLGLQYTHIGIDLWSLLAWLAFFISATCALTVHSLRQRKPTKLAR